MVKNRGGFTLFEVMITMAVSASMLVVAIVMFGGQQRKVQFAQGVQDIRQTVQDVITSTSTGYFPSSTYTCSASLTGPVLGAGGEQGANKECIFMGKAMHFKDNQVDVYPIAGNRVDASVAGAVFQTALPKAIPELVTSKVFRSNIRLYEVWWADNVTSHSSDGRLFVFASTPNGTGLAANGDSFNSGTQKIQAYSSGTSPATAVAAGDNDTALTTVMRLPAFSWPSASNEVTLCFEDDTIGNSGRQKAGVVITGAGGGVSARARLESDTVVCS